MSSDFIEYQIHGDNMQILEVELDPGEAMLAETGSMIMMEDGIEMSTTTGGMFSALKRKMSGEGFFISQYTHKGRQPKAKVGFASPYPGHIVPINLVDHRGIFVCQKDAFLACAKGVDLSIYLNKRIGAGLFGKEGFILQKIEGIGMAFVHGGGNIVEKTLAPGEMLRIDAGCVMGFTHGVEFDIEYIGGFMNPLFGGEGVFLARLKGPGKVMIQSLPFQRIIDSVKTGLNKSGNKLK